MVQFSILIVTLGILAWTSAREPTPRKSLPNLDKRLSGLLVSRQGGPSCADGLSCAIGQFCITNGCCEDGAVACSDSSGGGCCDAGEFCTDDGGPGCCSVGEVCSGGATGILTLPNGGPVATPGAGTGSSGGSSGSAGGGLPHNYAMAISPPNTVIASALLFISSILLA